MVLRYQLWQRKVNDLFQHARQLLGFFTLAGPSVHFASNTEAEGLRQFKGRYLASEARVAGLGLYMTAIIGLVFAFLFTPVFGIILTSQNM